MQVNWEKVYREAPEWFRDAKFGLFFHWGPYSVPAYQNEWYSRNMYIKGLEQNQYHERTYGDLHNFGYKDFYSLMTGKKFDPEEWADLVKRSGAKYAGPVSEHADNFSMWSSMVNPVNSVNYGPGRDVVGECLKAFRNRGIRTMATFHHQWLWGWFMSTDSEADVYDPENEKFYGPALPLETGRYLPYRYPDKKFCSVWRDKVQEVVSLYCPDIIYFDSRACIIEEKYRYEAVKYYYEKTGGIITYKQEDFPQGIGVFDLERGRLSGPAEFPWQSDDRLEDNTTWCIVQNPKYKPSERIIHQLCDIVSKNGNLLLNVGPCADGSFHPNAVRILEEIGDWLSVNGEAIYGTRPFLIAAEGPTSMDNTEYNVDQVRRQLKGGSEEATTKERRMTEQDFRFTVGKDAVYAIAMRWPEDGIFHIKSMREGGILSGKIKKLTLLGEKEELPFRRDKHGLHVQAPLKRPCLSAYGLKIEA